MKWLQHTFVLRVFPPLVLMISLTCHARVLLSQQTIGLYEAAIRLASELEGAEIIEADRISEHLRSIGYPITAADLDNNFIFRSYTSEPCYYDPESGVVDCTIRGLMEAVPGMVRMAPKSTRASGSAASGKSVGQFLSGIPVTNLADGLSVFLVNRAKKELSVAFFDKLTDEIREIPALVENFPSTALQVHAIGDEIYQFEKFIQSLRQAFITDFKGLPGNFGRYLMANETLIRNDGLRAMAGDGLHAMQAFISAKEFPEIITYLASDSSYIQSSNAFHLDLLKNILKTTDVALNAFRKADNSWIDFNDFNKMMQNDLQLDMFFTLLLHEVNQRGITYPGNMTFEKLLVEHFERVQAQLSGMIYQVNQMVIYVEQLNTGERASTTDFDDYYQLLTGLFAIAETGYRLLPAGSTGDTAEVEKFFSVSRGLTSLTLYVYQKKYSAAVTQMIGVLKDLKVIGGAGIHAKSGNTQREKSLKKLVEKSVLRFQKYVRFFAMIAEAEDGNAVAQVIEQFAAPVGSSVEKRRNDFTWGVNGYVGMNGFGREIATGNNIPVALEDEPFYAVSAPLGLSANIGLWDRWSVGIFGSLIDLGAITAYRFDDENTEDLPEITLGNIFAPGMHLEIGFNNIPLTIGYGWQWGPNLRKVTNEALEVDDFSTRRQSAFIRVDIPVLWF